MKNKIYHTAVALMIAMPSLLYSQSGHYELSGKIGEYSAPAKIYLFSLSTGLRDSALMDKGTFHFAKDIEQPMAVNLFINPTGNGIMLNGGVFHRSSTPILPLVQLYLEPGKIVVNSQDSLKTVQITGGQVNTDNNRLNAALAPINQEIAELGAEYRAAPMENQKSKAFITDIQKRLNAIKDKQAAVYLAFIKANPNSLISLFTLRSYAGDIPDIDVVEPLYNSLSADVRSSKAGIAYGSELAEIKKTSIGAIAPDFTMPDTSNNIIALQQFRGKYVLVDFWASWCGPCRAENPNVLKAYDTYKAKNFTVLGISLDKADARDKWLKAIHDDHLEWTQLADLKGWKNEAALLYSVRAIPQNFLIDPQGKIIAHNIRGEELFKKLQEIFKE